MTDLVVTAGSVIPGANARLEQGFAGEALTPFQPVYKASTGLWMKADSNSATALARAATAVAANTAAAGQPVTVQKSGQMTVGAIVTANLTYWLSDTAGGVAPIADVGAGEYGCLICVAVSATVVDLILKYTAASN